MIASSLHLDPAAATPLYRQIYDQIRDAILTGRLAPGTRLTSSRVLARHLGIGRITVTAAYERLAGEGYAESRSGAGTWVAAALPGVGGRDRPAVGRENDGPPVCVPPHVAEFVRTSRDIIDVPGRRVEFDFRFLGQAFPMVEWRRMLARHWSTVDTERYLSMPSEGDLKLRQQIAHYLRTARGARCDEEQILATSTVGHAFDLVAHLLLDRGDAVLVEDPCLETSRMAFQSHGVQVIPVGVDRDGVDPDAVEQYRNPGIRLLCLMPSRQWPTGATLSLRRRLRLLEWAERTGSLILEDDRFSEYRYGDAVLESMQGLDTGQVVLYVGTFHRLLASTVRVAYLVVPPCLVRAARAVQAATDADPPPFVQSALADFMASGLFARHQRRLQRIHRRRRDALLTALTATFGDRVVIGPARAGHDVHVRFIDHPATDDVIATALRKGVGLMAVRPFYLGRPPADPGVVMAYGGLDEATIERGVTRLRDVLSPHSRAGART